MQPGLLALVFACAVNLGSTKANGSFRGSAASIDLVYITLVCERWITMSYRRCNGVIIEPDPARQPGMLTVFLERLL